MHIWAVSPGLGRWSQKKDIKFGQWCVEWIQGDLKKRNGGYNHVSLCTHMNSSKVKRNYFKMKAQIFFNKNRSYRYRAVITEFLRSGMCEWLGWGSAHALTHFTRLWRENTQKSIRAMRQLGRCTDGVTRPLTEVFLLWKRDHEMNSDKNWNTGTSQILKVFIWVPGVWLVNSSRRRDLRN